MGCAQDEVVTRAPGAATTVPRDGAESHRPRSIAPDASAIVQLIASDQSRPHGAGSTAERWALLVLRALACASDPKTLGIWARTANVSRSALCEYCRLVHVSPQDARNFARVLRAVIRSEQLWQPEAVIDVADARTLRKLLERAGLVDATAVPTPEEFFDRQAWIPRTNPGLAALCDMLNGRARGQ
jgi:hypothetical protein